MSGRKGARAAYYYAFGIGGLIFGATYAFPPFYGAFCEKTGYGGSDRSRVKYVKMANTQNIHRKFKINFQGNVDPDLDWSFWPLQDSLEVNSGDTVLAFFRANNRTTEPIIGISAYVIQPDSAIDHFHKIQCFCFDE